MLKTRVITAVVLLPFVGLLLFVAPLSWFNYILLLIVGAMAWEWSRLAGIKANHLQWLVAVIFVAVFALIGWNFQPTHYALRDLLETASVNTLPHVLFVLSLVGWLFAILAVLGAGRRVSLLPAMWGPKLLLGMILLGGFWLSAIAIRAQFAEQTAYFGPWLLLFMLTLIWAADIGAYFVGKTIGRRKLAPAVSPGKTWEGMLGGLVCSILVSWLNVAWLDLPVFNHWLVTAAFAGLAVVSVFGDLFISLLKRQANMKDSSQLLPGHGGLLDRLDSTIAVAPVYILVLHSFGWLTWS